MPGFQFRLKYTFWDQGVPRSDAFGRERWRFISLVVASSFGPLSPSLFFSILSTLLHTFLFLLPVPICSLFPSLPSSASSSRRADGGADEAVIGICWGPQTAQTLIVARLRVLRCWKAVLTCWCSRLAGARAGRDAHVVSYVEISWWHFNWLLVVCYFFLRYDKCIGCFDVKASVIIFRSHIFFYPNY